MNESVSIRPGAAIEDVKQIENIVKDIEECLSVLNNVIEKNIPENLETDWSVALKESWTKAYNESIQGVMHEMTLSASNLQMAIDRAIEYSKAEN